MNTYQLTAVEGTVYNLTIAEGTNVGQQTTPNKLIIPFICNTPIGGGRAVRGVEAGLVDYASASNTDHTNVIGITMEAVDSGAINVCTGGLMVDSSWTWVVGPLYVGENGVLTQTAPSIGFVLEVGTAISATTIVVNLGFPLILT